MGKCDEMLIQVMMGGYNYRVCCEYMIRGYAGMVILEDKLV